MTLPRGGGSGRPARSIGDSRIIQCNVIKGNSHISNGARAYLLWTSGDMRHNFYVRTVSGRFVMQWFDASNMKNYRVKTMPPEHPFYGEVTDFGEHAETILRNYCDQSAS